MRRVCRAVLVIVLVARPALAAPAFDHSAFDRLLASHVENGLVDYDAFAKSPDFGQYLARLAAADPEALGTPERLSLWINAYNAYTIHVVNLHVERKSIRNIVAPGASGPASNAWQQPVARVGGRAYTLDQIEHEVIRKRFPEPRIHFALACGAMGCAPLRREAYRGDRLQEQLQDQARLYLLGRTKGSRVDAANGVVYVSQIFSWYKDDFGGDDASIGRFIAQFYPDLVERRVLSSGRFRLVTLPYDWSLNSTAPAR